MYSHETRVRRNTGRKRATQCKCILRTTNFRSCTQNSSEVSLRRSWAAVLFLLCLNKTTEQRTNRNGIAGQNWIWNSPTRNRRTRTAKWWLSWRCRRRLSPSAAAQTDLESLFCSELPQCRCWTAPQNYRWSELRTGTLSSQPASGEHSTEEPCSNRDRSKPMIAHKMRKHENSATPT